MHLSTIAWITLLAPLVAATLILFVTRTNKPLAAGLAILSALITTAGGYILFFKGAEGTYHGFNWVDFGQAFSIPFDLALDPLLSLIHI